MVDKQDLAFVAAVAAAVSAVIAACITALVNIIVEKKRLQVAYLQAEAALKSAKAMETTALNSDIRRQEELQRDAVAALCKIETDNLEQLRAALSELAAIAHAGASSGTVQLDEHQRQQALFLALRLKMRVLPNMPLAEVLHLDIAKIRECLSQSGATTIANPSLWMRYFDNAMLLLDEEERRIRHQLVEGRYIERKSLKPQTTLRDSFDIHGHY